MKSLSTTAFSLAAAGLLCVWAVDRAFAATSAVEGVAKGKVVFEGKKPEPKPLSISPEASKGCCPPGKEVDMKDPSIVIGPNDGIANVVVTVEVDGATVTPGEPVHIDQKECHFEPHVQVVPVGGKIVYLNSDEVSHNVHTYAAKNDQINKTIAPGGKEEQTLTKSDRIEIKCDIHPWMKSYLVVTAAPFYAVSDAEGKFSVTGLPAGTHKVDYWHEKLGKGKAEITVKDDGTTDGFEIKLGGEKKGGGRRR